ncbi:unnamed protein product [Rotaria sordida]|uniref:Prohibitin n=1 Tax=Rotaria sordida TaxID=392033 RepID=A0A815N1R2_9BILA|nr:unnamed protein product [Rotaria sordida]CAF1437658.1 unnamed protein product [Rotaria sordida]CAF1484405.1 unnamed protein product [Rotaria sordida]
MLYNVDGDHRAVIFDRFQGVKLNVIGGTHFMILWLHRSIIFDIRTRLRSVPSITGTKRAELLPKIFTNLSLDYEEHVLPSITNGVLKYVVARFDAIELITQRALIFQRVSELLTERAAQFGLLLNDISIAEQSRQANVIAAAGEAGDGLIELQRIEAAEDIANQ